MEHAKPSDQSQVETRFAVIRAVPPMSAVVALMIGVGLRGPQETVKHIARIKVISGNRADGVVAKWSRALAGTCARARNIEGSDNAVKSTHEAVRHIA